MRSALLRAVDGILVAMLLQAAAPALAQPGYGLPPDAWAAFSRWLTTTCVGDEERALREALLRHRAQLAPAFRRALADGPPPQAVREVRAAAEVRHAALAQFPLQQYRIEGVTAADLARFERTPRQAYVDDQARRYATGYRANALAGLGIVGGPRDRAALARLAARKDDHLAPAAAEALRALERQ